MESRRALSSSGAGATVAGGAVSTGFREHAAIASVESINRPTRRVVRSMGSSPESERFEVATALRAAVGRQN
jgi:hypothetical protein